MFTTFVIVVLLLAAIIWPLAVPRIVIDRGTSREVVYHTRRYAFVFVGLAVLLIALTTITSVNAKSEGVLTTGGRVSDRTLNPGYSLKWPWQKVTEVDGKRKVDNFNGSDANDDDSTHYHGDISVKFGDGGVGSVKASIIWAPADGRSNEIFSNYRDDDPINNMRDNLVVPTFRDAVYATLRSYKPTGPIDTLEVDFSDPEAVTNAMKHLDLSPDLEAMSDQAEVAMNERLSKNGESLVHVEDVIISFMAIPEKAQQKIDDFNAEVNAARVALVRQATNTAIAKANEILADSLAKNPNVLVSRCFDLIEDGLLKPPAGSPICWPGTAATPVVPVS